MLEGLTISSSNDELGQQDRYFEDSGFLSPVQESIPCAEDMPMCEADAGGLNKDSANATVRNNPKKNSFSACFGKLFWIKMRVAEAYMQKNPRGTQRVLLLRVIKGSNDMRYSAAKTEGQPK